MDQPLRRLDRVTVFGGATIDRIARSSAAPVMGASNPGHARRLPGGVGFNVAAIIARLGIATRLVTRVGDDPEGEAVLLAARGAGVDTTAASVSHAAPTAGYYAVFDDRGNLVVGIADADVIEEIRPADVAPIAASATADELWVVDANLSAETLDFLIEEARVNDHPIAALTVSPAKALRLAPAIARLSYLFANKAEAAALLAGNAQVNTNIGVQHAARDLAHLGPLQVVVTGANGPLYVASGDDVRSFTPLRTDIKAVNGAGDSFAAGTIAALTEARSLNDSIRFGLAAAAMTVEHGSVAEAPFAPGALSARIAAGPRLAS